MPNIQSCIDHIKTAIDIDPWAADMAEKALKVMERREKTMRINEYQTLAARTINKNLTDVEMIPWLRWVEIMKRSDEFVKSLKQDDREMVKNLLKEFEQQHKEGE